MRQITDTHTGEIISDTDLTLEYLFVGDGMALITTYTELRSNELVKEQMDTYQSNNRKIAKLKEKEIDCNITKWWIYFGGE